MYENIKVRNENHDPLMPYNDKIYNEELTLIEDKIHEMYVKSLTDFRLPASVYKNSNNMGLLEKVLRR